MIYHLYHVLRGHLHRPANPTSHWPPHQKIDLIYHLSQKTLNAAITLGSPLDGLSRLGRCDDVVQVGDYIDLLYRESGLIVGLQADIVMTLSFVVGPGSPFFQQHHMEIAHPVLVDAAGQRHAFTDSCRLEEITASLGPPTQQNIVADNHVFSFWKENLWIDSHHDCKTGKLLQLEISFKHEET